jgi:hypothetical protein
MFSDETLFDSGYAASPNSVYADYPPAYSQGGTFNNPQYQKR